MKYYSEIIPCVISGDFGTDLHHITSRAAGGSDEIFNILPLKHIYHVEVHTIGLKKFAEKYREVDDWLYDNGWSFCSYRDKYIRGER